MCARQDHPQHRVVLILAVLTHLVLIKGMLNHFAPSCVKTIRFALNVAVLNRFVLSVRMLNRAPTCVAPSSASRSAFAPAPLRSLDMPDHFALSFELDLNTLNLRHANVNAARVGVGLESVAISSAPLIHASPPAARSSPRTPLNPRRARRRPHSFALRHRPSGHSLARTRRRRRHHIHRLLRGKPRQLHHRPTS